MRLLRITAPNFVAGIESDNGGRIIRAAPIVKYMLKWTDAAVLAYCSNKGWKGEEVHPRVVGSLFPTKHSPV